MTIIVPLSTWQIYVLILYRSKNIEVSYHVSHYKKKILHVNLVAFSCNKETYICHVYILGKRETSERSSIHRLPTGKP